MSITRTFTVTVVSTGSGNKYFIDGVQQATVELAEGGVYKFDQSDSSNYTHPLRFSTTSDGTHNSGSEYTTGVTTSGTPGSSGAYTQISVATSAPTLYYYCSAHPGMGGQANTPTSNTWGLLSWDDGQWGAQGNNSITLSAPSSATSALGTLVAYPEQGWGRDDWGQEPWGESFDPTIQLSSAGQLTTAVGSVTAFPEQGWGGDTWGFENWGENATTVFVDVASSGVATTAVGSISPTEMVVGLTGQSATSSVGTPGLLFGSGSLSLSGVSATTGVGSVLTGVIVSLTAPSNLTSSVGAITPADVVGISGVSATSNIGSVTVNDAQVFTPTAPSPATSAVGSIVVGIGVPLTAPSVATSSVGAITPADVMGLEGQEATTELGTTGLGTIAYKDIDITGNTSYTDVNHAA
jgi:hypothetical protein